MECGRLVEEIGSAGEGVFPIIEAWNEIGALPANEAERIRAEAARKGDVVTLSALTGEGVDDFVRCTADRLREGTHVHTVTLPVSAGEATAWLHANGEIIDQRTDGLATAFEVRISEPAWDRFRAQQGALLYNRRSA